MSASHGIVGVFACPCCQVCARACAKFYMYFVIIIIIIMDSVSYSFLQWEQHQCHLPNDVEGDGKADFLYTDPNLLSDKNLVRGSVIYRIYAFPLSCDA